MIETNEYTAKEAMQILKKSSTTFYREVQEGKIPHKGKRPNMRFPKEAIDALAELEAKEEEPKLLFKLSTIADAWTKQEITRQPYPDEDAVPFKTVVAWRKANDEISMHVECKGKILGWTTFLPLDENISKALINDQIKEKDIPVTSIKKWSDRNISVFIPIIEVVPSGNQKRDKVVGAFLIKKTIQWAISLMIQYDVKSWYANGVSPEGQAILEALGFTQVTSFDNGERKGYTLVGNFTHARLISQFVEGQSNSISLIEDKSSKRL